MPEWPHALQISFPTGWRPPNALFPPRGTSESATWCGGALAREVALDMPNALNTLARGPMLACRDLAPQPNVSWAPNIVQDTLKWNTFSTTPDKIFFAKGYGQDWTCTQLLRQIALFHAFSRHLPHLLPPKWPQNNTFACSTALVLHYAGPANRCALGAHGTRPPALAPTSDGRKSQYVSYSLS